MVGRGVNARRESTSILLDTHVVLWHFGDRRRLSAGSKAALDSAKVVLISAVSFWEVSMLVEKGRIELDRPVAAWVNDVLRVPRFAQAPLDADVAVTAGTLAGFHGDPADRFIVSTAMTIPCPLISKDRALRQWSKASGEVDCVW